MKNVDSILRASDEEILAEIRSLKVGYQLKRTMRYSTERDHTVHNESVAEHKFALLYLMHYFLPFEDPERLLNVGTVCSLITFHDFGEILNGDKPYHLKTAVHEQQEREDAKLVFSKLPESIRDIAYKSWHEYEQRSTLEARFVYALDKVEPMFELMDPVNELSLKRTRFTYQHHIVKKRQATEGFPVMRRFVEVGSADMLKRGVFWVDPLVTSG